MKWGWMIVLGLVAGGCNWFPKPGDPSIPGGSTAKQMIDRGGWVPTGNDDLDTVAICLLDFMKQGRTTSLVDGQRSTVVINRFTNGPGDFIAPEQVANETRRMGIPVGVLQSLAAKNTDTFEVTWIPPGLPFFVSDLHSLPTDLAEMATAMPTAYPKSFAAIWLWVPGYSEDGMWAIVRFTFAPTSHGAIATYILTKDDTGKWRINNRGLNYFVEPVQ